MDKTRIENLSDGLFAIVFTLLIIEIRVPEFHQLEVSNEDLWQALLNITPLFISYYVSFIVLVMFWISHHALFGIIGKVINRRLILINFLYLAFIAFVPFSSHLIGEYHKTELAFVMYGLNILAIGLVNLTMLQYAHYSNDIDSSKVTNRLYKQATFRFALTPLFSLLGIVTVFFSLTLALFFFAFPILFNTIPGGLDYIEKLFDFKFGKEKELL